jgi:co-chaperonin GroES (HSP10)
MPGYAQGGFVGGGMGDGTMMVELSPFDRKLLSDAGNVQLRVDGKVVAVPFKYETGVKPGDTMYFHHQVVVQEGQPLPILDNENQYLVRYDDEQTLACQAIAYKDQETSEINTVGGWLLLEPIETEEEENSEIIEVVSLEKKQIDCGRFTKHNKKSEYLDVKEGDIVYFRPGIAYEIKIDGKDYLRMRPEDLMYVKEE